MTRWFDRDALPHATRRDLVGIVELDRPVVELHVYAVNGRTVGLWLDELGRPIRVVVASLA